MRNYIFLIVLSLVLCNDPEKDMQVVYSRKDYNRFFSVGGFNIHFIHRIGFSCDIKSTLAYLDSIETLV